MASWPPLEYLEKVQVEHDNIYKYFYFKSTDQEFGVGDEDIHLSQEHYYYLQIHGQLAVCDREYCDFVSWIPCGMHVEIQ